MTKTWLKQNILEILAIIAVIQTIAVNFLILFRVVKSTDSITLVVVSNSANMAFLALNYFMGSSKGSKDKQEKLDKIDEKTA